MEHGHYAQQRRDNPTNTPKTENRNCGQLRIERIMQRRRKENQSVKILSSSRINQHTREESDVPMHFIILETPRAKTRRRR